LFEILNEDKLFVNTGSEILLKAFVFFESSRFQLT
jgi:hypothetical protein